MINKTYESIASAVEGITDGSTIMVGGFGTAGMPSELIDGLIATGARDLTIISNNAGNGEIGLAALLMAGSVRKVICSFPRQSDSYVFDELYRAARSNWKCPAGQPGRAHPRCRFGHRCVLLADRLRHPVGEGKETREIDGRQYVLEMPLHADFALIKAHKGDRWGNLTYRKAARNFGPIMAMAAKTAIAQVDQIVELGELDPEHIITPGIFVQRVVAVSGAALLRSPKLSEACHDHHQKTLPHRDGPARGRRHPGRRVRQPRYRRTDPGGQLPGRQGSVPA
ncbi:3-oxoacid CoA-transferase subunit A [Pseudomonas bharatica]|uniref:3-oxoacid CoA-transferase subunit A n=1 Tax=Pseudomonas bharatica TaxID=2692112 RepID=UPI001F045DF6|nr:3-oxoacid CoA-transferase subunit A [Pseudomonas bharatica]